ncbi:Hexosaminidase D [Armadillidium vulgare]|nr:Hexosaminidase D [Armadillidium vulgare]
MVNLIYKHRLVHFDFKGAIPRISFLEKIIPLISSWGATGVLIEYEDSLPYSGNLTQLQSPYAFTVKQINQIQSICKENNLEVIPLVQTFGHLEFVLKHDEFRHLREMDLYPNALCPFHPDALELVLSLIDSVMALHPNSNYLHIGADEVWHLGKCHKCHSEMAGRGWESSDLFLQWVSKIALILKKKYPMITLIMWDDMMRNCPETKLKGMFDVYSKVFDRIWAASSYKGSTGSTQFIPPVQHHIDNHLTWITTLKEHQSKFKEICGIALTGWQRYDHYAVLCELLPVAIPCLGLCLRVLKSESFLMSDHEEISQQLGFHGLINVFPFPRPQILEQEMSFPGHELYIAVQMWSNFVYKYQMICNSEGMLGWFSDYFRSRNFTNPAQVETIMFQLVELEGNLFELKGHMRNILLQIFYEDTSEEWIGCFFSPLLTRIKSIINDCKLQMQIGGRTKDYKFDKVLQSENSY